MASAYCFKRPRKTILNYQFEPYKLTTSPSELGTTYSVVRCWQGSTQEEVKVTLDSKPADYEKVEKLAHVMLTLATTCYTDGQDDIRMKDADIFKGFSSVC